MNGLYNKNVHWPDNVSKAVSAKLNKKYCIYTTNHMKEKARKLRVPIGSYKTCLYGEVVEAKFENDSVVKVITRVHNRYNAHKDLCFAVGFVKNKNGIEIAQVRTVWTNSSDDNHSTIHSENYVKE